MDPMQIFLIILLALIVMINFRYLTVGKKKKKESTKKYARALAVLVKNEKKLGGEGNYLAAHYVNDIGDNMLVCRSQKNGSKALVTEESFYFFEKGDSVSCEIVEECDDKGRIKSLMCKLSSTELDNDLFVIFSSKPRSRNNLISKMVADAAKDFKEEILK